MARGHLITTIDGKGPTKHKRRITSVRAYKLQKLNARIRKIRWDLSYSQWLQIWKDSGHLHERGRKSGQWVMARFRDQGGYEHWNVQIIRAEENIREAHFIRKHHQK